MRFKKSIAFLLAAMLVVAAFAMGASADTTVSVGGASYEVISPAAIELTATGAGATLAAKGAGGTIMDLADGNISRDVTTFDSRGVVLVVNDFVSKSPDRNGGVVKQDEIQTFSFEMDFGKSVSFDTAYMAIYYEVAVGIPTPADNHVIVETSKDGKVWVPVGEDGSYYYSFRPTEDYEDGKGKPYVGEVTIPLGETVKSQYVRYTFSFGVIPEGYHWTYYTNVYEFCGFTELGVANFKSGRKPAKLSAEDAATYPSVEGEWIVEDGDEISVVTFADKAGAMTYTAKVYAKDAYLASGAEAEVSDTIEGSYFIEGDTVVLITNSGYDEYTASVSEDGNLVLDMDGEEYTYYTAENFAAANGVETSDPETSDTETTEPADSSDESSADATSSAVSETSSKAESSVSTGTSSAAGTSSTAASTSEGEDGGASVGLIVGIIAAVVVAAGAAAAVVVSRKKKQ